MLKRFLSAALICGALAIGGNAYSFTNDSLDLIPATKQDVKDIKDRLDRLERKLDLLTINKPVEPVVVSEPVKPTYADGYTDAEGWTYHKDSNTWTRPVYTPVPQRTWGNYTPYRPQANFMPVFRNCGGGG